MNEAKQNYEIYDHEMLTIYNTSLDWCHFLENLPKPFEIWFDHANLQYWTIMQHLIHYQACSSLHLTNFNFKLIYKPGSTQTHTDLLSCLPEHQVIDADNNQDCVVLKLEYFKTIATTVFIFAEATALEKCIHECSKHETEVTQTLKVLQKKGSQCFTYGILEWENFDSLLYYKGKLYIAKDNKLSSEVIKTCYDFSITRHSEKHGTLELVQRYY